MNKEEMKKMLPLIKEWVENESAELYCCGVLLLTPAFDTRLEDYEIKYPKKTIIINGVEVPAPEKKEPIRGSRYFVADPADTDSHCESCWYEDEEDYFRLTNGLVYLNSEDAIARSKAMLIFKEK